MADATAAIIAVTGTLLGSALTYLFQLKMSERDKASTFQREVRAERVRAYSAYSTALTEFTNGQLDWYNRRDENPDSAMTLAARVESYRLKAVAQTALFQVRLVAGDPLLVEVASKAFEVTRHIHHARDPASLKARRTPANEALNHFVAMAATEVQSAVSHASVQELWGDHGDAPSSTGP